MATIVLGLAQSKTAFVAWCLSFPILFISSIATGRQATHRLVLLISLLIIVILPIYASQGEELTQVNKLLTVVHETWSTGSSQLSSLQARTWLWNYYLSVAGQIGPLWQLIGPGRTYMGNMNMGRVYDSDYIYFLLVHGLFGLVAVYGLVTYSLLRAAILWTRQTVEKRMLVFATTAGLFLGLGASYFTNPRISTLFALLLGLSFRPSSTDPR